MNTITYDSHPDPPSHEVTYFSSQSAPTFHLKVPLASHVHPSRFPEKPRPRDHTRIPYIIHPAPPPSTKPAAPKPHIPSIRQLTFGF
jgi:hypothetical protein